jgi:hypothetical protein
MYGAWPEMQKRNAWIEQHVIQCLTTVEPTVAGTPEYQR